MTIEMLYVFILGMLGGIVQASTGFGAGIVQMIFMPLFLPMLQASALTTILNIWFGLTLFLQYRRSVRYDLIKIPLIGSLIFCYIAIDISTRIDVSGLKSIFGLFMVILALYFIFFEHRIHIKPTVPAALTTSAISGLGNGFFGIGGPPIAIYLLSAIEDDIYAYVATIQLFFVINNIFATGVRFSKGIDLVSILPLIIPGMIGMTLGKSIGLRILNRLNIKTVKKLVYILLALSGIITIINAL